MRASLSERSRDHARQIRLDPRGEHGVDHGGYLRTCPKCGCQVFEKKGTAQGECPACVHGISPVNLPTVKP